MSNIEVKVNAEAIHSALRRACPQIEEAVLHVMYDAIGRPHPAVRKWGHESLADYDVAIQVLEIVNKELGDEANIVWKVHHVPGLIGRFSIDPEVLIEVPSGESLEGRIEKVPGKTGVYIIDEGSQLKFKNLLQGHIYALPGHGNTTRALEWIRRRGVYLTWDSVPPELKKQVYTNAATLISIKYPDGGSVASVLHLHGGETLSALRKVQGQYSVGNRGRDIEIPLHGYDYRVDPTKAIRIICPNYLGSVANEQHIGVFRRIARDYCLKFGPEGLDVSFDLAEWNTPTDVGRAIVMEHRAHGMVDVRFLTPNINPNRDATLQVFDIGVPRDIIETINGYCGTSNEERLEDSHNLRDLSERLDAVILLEDLIIGTKDPTNKLKLDFREAVLDGRAAEIISFYREEGKGQQFGKEIAREGDIYYFKRRIGTDIELKLQPIELPELSKTESYEGLVNAGVCFYKEGEYNEAIEAFSQARRIIEKRISEESAKSPNVIREDYRDILELRVQSSAVYHNISRTKLKLSTVELSDAETKHEAEVKTTLEKTQLDREKRLKIKHLADLAFLYNPHDGYILHTLGKIHEEFDRELVGTDEAGALRRARIFYKYALEQVDQDISKSGSDKNELEKQKEIILSDYIGALERLVTLGYENLEAELKKIVGIRKDLNRELYGALEESCTAHNKNYAIIRDAIDSLDTQREYRQIWIPRVCNILNDTKRTIDERELIVWATTDIHSHKFINLIGRGAYGVVFEAVHDPTSEHRAVKVIDLLERTKRHLRDSGTDVVEMVIQEYKNAKQQYDQHGGVIAPYVVRVIDVTPDEISKRYGIIQELMGGDFYELQKGWKTPEKGPDIRPQNAKHFTLSLCKALEAIHSIKFYHRDLSPTNILYITGGGDQVTYRLGDFGLSEREGEINRLSLSIVAAYIRDPHPENPAMADLYATGSNIILAYTGVQPFVEQNPRPRDPNDMKAREIFERGLLQAKVERQGLDLLCANLPNGLNDIVLRIMEPDPEKRGITTAKQLYEEVKAVLER